MRKLFDKLTGRDKLKAEIIKLERVSKRLLSRNGGLIQENRELKIRLEYTEQPVEKVEEVQEVLALGFKPFEETLPKLIRVKLFGFPEEDYLEGVDYRVKEEGGIYYVLNDLGQKMYFNLVTGTYGWFNKINVDNWHLQDRRIEPVEYA